MDLFNKKLKLEKLYNQEIPNYIITKKFMKIFKDINLRGKIYNYGFQNYEKGEEYFNNFMEFYNINPDLSLYMIDNDIELNKENIEVIKTFGKSVTEYNIETIKPNLNELLEYKNKYDNDTFLKILNEPSYYLPILKKYNNVNDEIIFGNKIKFNQFTQTLSFVNQDINKLRIKLLNKVGIDLYLKYSEDINYLSNDALSFVIEYGYINEIIELNKKIVRNSKTIPIDEFIYINIIELAKETNNIDIFNKYIDYKINNLLYLKDNKNNYKLKELIYYKYFGTHRFKCEKQINTLKNKVQNINEDVLSTIKFIEEIAKEKDVNNIIQLISNFKPNMTGLDIQNYIFNLRIYEKEYQQRLYNPINDKSNKKTIEYDGVSITYIESDIVEYEALIHRIDPTRKNDLGPNKMEVASNPGVFDGEIIGSDILSLSLLYEFNNSTFGKPENNENSVLLGFSYLENNNILKTKHNDAGTNMSGSGKDLSKELTKDILEPNELKMNTLKNSGRYNEVAISRKEQGKKKKPDYVLVLKNFGEHSIPLNENTLKYAKYYNIPIVEIDGNKVKKHAKDNLDNKLNEIRSKNHISLEDFILVFKYICSLKMTYDKRFDKFINLTEYLDEFIKINGDNIEDTIDILNFVKEAGYDTERNYAINKLNTLTNQSKTI
ncbi:MAG: hypothetical protein IJZ36_02290 [Bacilli bacterium]|nr:hypothetical protein [Bacilli bacterium]